MTSPILEVSGLRVHYGPVRALNDISFQVAAGSMVAIIGSNGAGKTTTLKSLSGLVELEGGRIAFNGEFIQGLEAEKRVSRGMAHVPEGRRVFPLMSVWENLQLGGYTRPESEISQDLDHVVSLFPVLGERRRQYAGTLSGGEQQMLAIGRALMSRPRLLLMDEPSMGLAPQMVELILDKITAIRDSGTTVLLVEQNAADAIRLSDYVYVLRLGEIVHQSKGSEIDSELLKTLYLGHNL
jgi:branched-chain amino acid transport system ATP-binding protein